MSTLTKQTPVLGVGLFAESVTSTTTPNFTEDTANALRADKTTGALLTKSVGGSEVVIDAATSDITVYGQFDDVATTLPSENGLAAARITEYRAFHVNLRNASGSEITTLPVSLASVPSHAVTNAGVFAIQDSEKIADDAAFTVGTTKVMPVGFLADETATDSVDEGDIGASRMTLDRKQIVTDYAHAAGGSTNYSTLSTAAVLAVEIKSSSGKVTDVQIFNKGAAAIYVRLYNQVGAPASTDGANIVWRGIVPGSTAGAGFVVQFPKGRDFSTGIGIRASSAIADNDTTVLVANEVVFNVGYK